MLIIVTASERNGGILQFAITLFNKSRAFAEEVKLFVPDTNAIFEKEIEQHVIRYAKVKSLNNKDKGILDVAALIEGLNPKAVLFDEDIMCSLQLAMHLPQSIEKIMVIHDVAPHLRHFNPRKVCVDIIVRRMRNKVFPLLDKVILLSSNSLEKFEMKYPAWKAKAVLMPLGAHIPKEGYCRPAGLPQDEQGYFLFFGRLDRYKGIERMLTAYSRTKTQEKPALVIAGFGHLTNKEQSLISKTERVVCIESFMSDSEMQYIMQHARAVILPYIEASQSGVLPMAYYYGLPVIASNIAGLSEYVHDGVTGFLCNNVQDFSEAIDALADSALAKRLGENAKKYEREHLDWAKNLKEALT